MNAIDFALGQSLALLLRSSAFLALLLGPALLLNLPRLRLRAAVRHTLLLAVLLVAALAPVWLAVGGVAGHRGPPHAGAEAVILVAEATASGPTVQGREAGLRLARVWAQRPPWVTPLVLSIWAGGLLLGLVRIGYGARQIRRMRVRARAAPDLPQVLISDDIDAALVVGVFAPVVLLAPALLQAPRAALDQILAHERAHLRRRDPLWGLLQRIVTSVYWFHPLVHLAARALARSREEACDDDVIARHDRFDYAQTLLALVVGSRGPGGALRGAMQIQTGIEARVRRIVAPTICAAGGREILRVVVIAAALSLLGGRLAFALAVPVRGIAGAVMSAPIDLIPASERAVFELAGPRGQGAFVLHDLQRGRTAILNPVLAQQRLTPASTFKIIIALLALESGVLADERVTFRWDGHPHEMTGWNQDLDLTQAMRLSATWYFDRLLAGLDHGQVARALRDMGYGNADTRGDPRTFWRDDTLQITAWEQADVMARLASNGLGAGGRTRAIVDRITQIDSRGGATMYGKTGTALTDQEVIAWLVGHVEWNGRRFSYATVMRAPAADSDLLRAQRLEITRTLLARQGAYPAGPGGD